MSSRVMSGNGREHIEHDLIRTGAAVEFEVRGHRAIRRADGGNDGEPMKKGAEFALRPLFLLAQRQGLLNDWRARASQRRALL